MCFSSYKNNELKVKKWWFGARERKKSAFVVTFILSEKNFYVFLLSQVVVYWVNFQNGYTFTYQKTYTFVACF